jgi:hypothetical protein
MSSFTYMLINISFFVQRLTLTRIWYYNNLFIKCEPINLYEYMIPLKQKIFYRHTFAPPLVCHQQDTSSDYLCGEAFQYEESVKPSTLISLLCQERRSARSSHLTFSSHTKWNWTPHLNHKSSYYKCSTFNFLSNVKLMQSFYSHLTIRQICLSQI